MDGSRGSIPHNTTTRRVFAVVALLALIATACGGKTETQTTTSASAQDDAEYAGWSDADSADDAEQTPGEPVDASEGKTFGSPSSDEAPTEGVPVDAIPSGSPQSAQVLAYAIEASEELSYSFEQGMSMQMTMLGMDLDISPADAYVTGEVSGEESHLRADIGAFMVSMFDSLGLDSSDPMFASMFGDLESMTMEVWTVDGYLVIDMSGMAASLGSLDPAAAGEFGVFADGPVKIDLDALSALGGADAGSIVQQYGQGAQVTDPAALIDALRLIDAVTDTGASSVNGTPVTVYSASLSMADYYEALGMDVTDQLGSMEDFGFAAGSDEAALMEAIAPVIEDLMVDLTIMLDDDGLVRRMETTMDMGAMFEAMGSGEVEGAEMFGSGDIEMTVNVWQNFDDYGSDITIVAPDAIDRTTELAGLIDS